MAAQPFPFSSLNGWKDGVGVDENPAALASVRRFVTVLIQKLIERIQIELEKLRTLARR